MHVAPNQHDAEEAMRPHLARLLDQPQSGYRTGREDALEQALDAALALLGVQR